jgi:ribose/xylose/arabinose/galactoside ABC-type transport system permease subunit
MEAHAPQQNQVAMGAPAPGESPLRRAGRFLRALTSANEAVLVLVLLVLATAIQLRNDNFLTPENLKDIARAMSFMLIVATAQTLVLISGSLDLSVGSIYALGGVITAQCLTSGMPIVLAIAIGLLAGLAAGALNGIVVVRFKVPALIATLGTLYAIDGLVLRLTDGNPVSKLPDAFNAIGQDELLGIPIPVWIALAVVVAGQFMLSRSVFGRRIYAVGGSDRAAYLAGVPRDRIRFAVFLLSGLAAALAGILITARIGSAQVSSGTGLELQVIAAAVIGGTSLFGGSGNAVGTLLGSLLIAVIANGMVLTEVSPFYQNIIVGTIIILAVGLDGWRRRRLEAR